MTRRPQGSMLCPHCGQPRTDHDGADVLCCAAAWAQWHCRQCGETSVAFAFPYGRCPRCGGPLALSQSSLDPGPDTAAIAAVRTAFEIELGGRAFYQRAAVEATDDSMRALFRRFAAMEGQHMEALARRHHITEIPPTPEAFGTELAALFAGVESRPNEPGNLFRIAIAAEHRAAGFFLARAARARAGSAEQRQCLQLAAEEHEHAQTLSTEFRLWRERQARRGAARPTHAPDAPGPASFLNAAELLLAQADPSRVAIACGTEYLDYRELRARVSRAAGAWRQRGLRPGDRVAVKLADGIDWVVAFLGTIWAGGIAVGVNPQAPEADWHHILDEAGFSIIVADSDAGTPPPWKGRVVAVDDARREFAAAAQAAPLYVPADTPAFWCHSSGTSGKPRAVVHRHGFAREIERIPRERLGVMASDRLFATPRLFFSYPQANSLFAGLKIGATVIVDPQWPTAASVAATVARMRPSVFFSVPSLYRSLLHAGLAPALAASGVRRCVSAGEALTPSLRQAWREATGLGLVDGYVTSETQVLVLTAEPGEDGLRPSPGVEVRPLDAEAAAAGVPTRLCIRVPTMALGYLDRPAAQAEGFREGTFCPEDLFVGTDTGGWRFAGRVDGLVKVMGRWVNLSELEEKLAAGVRGLLEAAAVCVPGSDGDQTIALFYVARPQDRREVEHDLRDRAAALPPHQRPSSWHALHALPRTATGKLLRRTLAGMLAAAQGDE
ncbi:MAG: AMP-binding protein [Ramlibacter sp.]|nr:AMP-binding protein [Ramlibacter sp.]